MRRHGLIGAVVATAILASAGQAAALSCAAHPDGSPASIVAGTEKLAGDVPFFEQYDLAIVGTPAPPPKIPTPGARLPYRATTFTVDAAFGVAEIPKTIVVTTGFPLLPPGEPQIAGFDVFFDPAKTWFVPLKTQGPDGLTNHSFPCDPISAVGRDEIPGLIAGARPGLPVAVPDGIVPSAPALAIAKSAPAQAPAGATIRYSITVRNIGDRDARMVRIVDALPAGVRLLRLKTTHPRVRRPYAIYRRALAAYRAAGPGTRRAAYRRMIARRGAMRQIRFGSRYLPRRSGTAVTFRLGKLKFGASRTVHLTVRVRPRASGTLVNRATASASGVAPVSATAATRIVPPAPGG